MTGVLTRIVRPAALDAAAPALRTRLVLSNQIALILACISAIGIAANAVLGDGAMVVGSALLLIPVAGTPRLMAGARPDAARLLLVLGGPLLLMGPGLLGDGVDLANLVALPYAVLTMSLLPSLVFDPRTERGLRSWCNVYLGLILVGHDLALAHVGGQALPPPNAKLAQLVLWALILAALHFTGRQRHERPGERR
jgi:hypothetical protein